MFKKATVLNQQKLRGSDVKRLKKDMQLAFNLSEEEVDSAVPSRADVIMTKWSNRALVYAVDGRNPLVFDPVRPSRSARARCGPPGRAQQPCCASACIESAAACR